jgi:stage II sporulation protein Q
MARKLKRYVVPSVLGFLGVGLLIGTPIYMNETKTVKSNYKYTIKEDSNTDRIFPVLNEVEENKPLRPFLEETVGKAKDYYNKKDTESDQINSLVYYENTYMPNTGILYSSDEVFDVIAVMDGTITKVGDDNILGRYVEIEHPNGYKTTYYSLSETGVTMGSSVTKGDVIGISGTNKLEGTLKNNLLFETYLDGLLLDPEDFYNVDFNKEN